MSRRAAPAARSTRRPATPRRPRAHAKRRGGSPLAPFARLLRTLVPLAIIALVLSWVGGTYWYARAAVVPARATGVQQFATTPEVDTILLVTEGPDTSTLAGLAVLRLDRHAQSATYVSLPPTLAQDGVTAAQLVGRRHLRQLQQVVENAIAIPLDTYLIQTRDTASPGLAGADSLKAWASLANTTFQLPLTLRDMAALESPRDAKALWADVWFLRGVAPAAYHVVDTTSATIPTEGGLALDPASVDPLVRAALAPSAVVDDAPTVIIRNGTSVTGLAGIVGRYVENMGADVVAVEGSDAQLSTTVTAATASPLTDEVARFLGIDLTTAEPTGRERASIDITIGNDALKRLGK